MSEAREHIGMIPEHIRDGMLRYIEERIEPGQFLSSVLKNDLKGSFAQADHINRSAMFDIVSFLYNYAPSQCWGSRERFETWLMERDDNE